MKRKLKSLEECQKIQANSYGITKTMEKYFGKEIEIGEIKDSDINYESISGDDKGYWYHESWFEKEASEASEAPELIPNLDYILAKIEKDSRSLTNIITILKTVDYESAVWIVKYLSEKVLK